MTVLVFGKTGQVARELQAYPSVKIVGRDDVDLSEPRKCAALVSDIGPSAVINAAAYTAVDKAEEEEDLATVVNGRAPAAIAEACAALDIPIVHISTDYVFDGSGTEGWKPDDSPDPINAYGRSKLVGERGVQAAGGRYAILRTSWVFSAHGNNFLKTMLRLADSRSRLSVVDDQVGGPTFAGDIAKACLVIADGLKSDRTKSGVYHFSGTPSASWADFAEAIMRAACKDVGVHRISTAEFPTTAARPLNSRLDCSATSDAFGIAQSDWREATELIIRELEEARP